VLLTALLAQVVASKMERHSGRPRRVALDGGRTRDQFYITWASFLKERSGHIWRREAVRSWFWIAPVLALLFTGTPLSLVAPAVAQADAAPKFAVDPYGPKPLPENWIVGQVAGIAVDGQNNIWVIHRPNTLLDDEKGALQNLPTTKCC
jgi:hypothetical protein